EVVKTEHEMVIRRPCRPARMKQAEQVASEPVAPATGSLRGQTHLLSKTREQSAKRLRGCPDARLRGVDIHKQAQNAMPIRRTAGKGVHVKQVVARLVSQLPRRFLNWPKTDLIKLPAGRVT